MRAKSRSHRGLTHSDAGRYLPPPDAFAPSVRRSHARRRGCRRARRRMQRHHRVAHCRLHQCRGHRVAVRPRRHADHRAVRLSAPGQGARPDRPIGVARLCVQLRLSAPARALADAAAWVGGAVESPGRFGTVRRDHPGADRRLGVRLQLRPRQREGRAGAVGSDDVRDGDHGVAVRQARGAGRGLDRAPRRLQDPGG